MCNAKTQTSSGTYRSKLIIDVTKVGYEKPLSSAPTAINCGQCGALHYQAQLACRKCGAYFLPAQAPRAAKLSSKAFVAAAAVFIGAAATLASIMF